MIRNATLLISGSLLRQARLAAELAGLDCAESWVEMTIKQALDAKPELQDLYNRREAARKRADAEWRAAHNL